MTVTDEALPEAGAPDAAPSAASRDLILVLLLAAYVLNFADRQVMSALAPAMKADLALTDTQLGRTRLKLTLLSHRFVSKCSSQNDPRRWIGMNYSPLRGSGSSLSRGRS